MGSDSVRSVNVVFLSSQAGHDQIADHAVVVIDVLRATTTIITALQNGAHEIIPCAEIEQARALATTTDPPGILGGERKGLRIPGFDLGNSPAEYTPDIIRGRRIIMATTNGTPAMAACRSAKVVWIAAFINLSAIVQRMREEPKITFLCAGTNGLVTGEDVLFAGCALEQLMSDGLARGCNDQAMLALAAWRDTHRRTESGERLAEILAQTHGGRNLVQNGLGADVATCAEIDRSSVVPQLDLSAWSIRVP